MSGQDRDGRRRQSRPDGNRVQRGYSHTGSNDKHENHADGQRTNDINRSHEPSPLNFNKLRRMVTSDQTDAVLDLVKHTQQLQNMLDDKTIQEVFIKMLLEILANVYNTHMKSNLMKILALFPNTPFLLKALPRYVMQLPVKGDRDPKIEEHVRHIVLFCDQFLRRFPDSYTDVPLDSLQVASIGMASVLQPSTLTQIEELIATRRAIMLGQRKKKSPPDVEQKPPDDFRQLSVHPVTNDFERGKKVFLRKNIVQGKYDSVDHYLDVQFRLLREDFLGPLREGIHEILDGVNRMDRAQNLRVYRDVEIIDIVCTNVGIVNTIRFSLHNLRNVNWENSKRFIFGAFLCLSKDDFNTLVFAVVTGREVDELKNGYLQVRFLGDIPVLQAGDRFQMVESPGYYESYVHNLTGLQELDEEKLPFSRYLVHCETTVEPPAYINADTTYETRSAFGVTDPKIVTNVQILNTASWPNVQNTHFNVSQMEAVKAALTKEFVVIQGPPGTGKTYVGLRIVQALLENSSSWTARHAEDSRLEHRMSAKSPMLVVCYTNHALDQFLEGILQFQCDGIVRVGGRSSSEVIKQHNLSQMTCRTAAWYATKEELQQLNKEMDETKRALASSFDRLLTLDELETVMEQQILDQLLPYSAVASYMRTTVIEQWLSMKPLNTYVDMEETSTEQTDYNDDNTTEEVPQDSAEGEDNDDVDVQKIGESTQLFYEGNNATGEDFNENVQSNDQEVGEMEKGDDNEDNEDKTVSNSDEGENKASEDVTSNNATETVDIVGEADVLQGERQLNDDYARITDTSEATTQIDMTHDYMNMVHQNWDDNELPQYRDRVVLQPDQSVWYFDYVTRQNLYKEWVKRYRERFIRELAESTRIYEDLCKEFNEVRYGEEERVLREAAVIGMTTTGAAKYRDVLQKVQPKIIVVEEAAEVLEAHIITSLSQRVEHLILIGDHKQLRPNANVFALAKEYNLDVSLFERMVKNGMTCHTLDTQHRMRPGISQLMTHIYDDLKDDESVTMFPDIDGISTNVFFIDHQEPELENEELRSRSNRHEATYIAALCRYLLLQGYDKGQITVLTTYTGQLLELKRLMPKKEFQGVRLCTVDNFQGEENDIILLSLVRSNSQEKIGFLGTPNRICVALSRAKMGFYCIGNISLLARKSNLWERIKSDMETRHAVGRGLPLYCRNHVKTKIYAATAKDFKKAPQGGCTLPCDVRLNCGHKCEMACHPVDVEHSNYVCRKMCNTLVCSSFHRCKKRCHHGEVCGPCQVPVRKQLTRCGHDQIVPCSVDELQFECKEPCTKFLPCNHRCRSTCMKDCNLTECQQMVEVDLRCGHQQTAMCSAPQDGIVCRVPCEQVLDCGHPCCGNCDECFQSRLHVPCQADCGRTLVCSHLCKEPCTRECPPCQQKCENACLHSSCGRKCGELCTPCQEPCLWSCDHRKCELKCSEICERRPCNVQCRKKLECSKENKPHYCVGLCGEKCLKLCRYCNKEELTEIFFGTEDNYRARFIELIDCGHVFEVTAMDKWMAYEEEGVANIKLKQCPKCNTPIRRSYRYGNVIKRVLSDIEEVKKKILKDDNKLNQDQLVIKLKELKKKYPNELVKVIEVRGIKRSKSTVYNLLVTACKENTQVDEIEIRMKLLGSIYKMKKCYTYVPRADHIEKHVESLVRVIVTWKLTDQVVKELQKEISRVTLLYRMIKIKQDVQVSRFTKEENLIRELNKLDAMLDSAAKIGESEYNQIDETLLSLRQKYSLGVISNVEKEEIIKAVGLSQGHWFKCRNGHIYAIGECGGAMQLGKCPECGDVIGGQNHGLVEGNELAPEMDGARYAAFSDQANLQNFDREELLRLQFQ